MPVFRLTPRSIEPLPQVSFADQGLRERADLQRLLRANIGVVAEDVLIISEEFGEWEDSRRRIDLLGVDGEANLVVIELKRDEEGGHMELAGGGSRPIGRKCQVPAEFRAGAGAPPCDPVPLQTLPRTPAPFQVRVAGLTRPLAAPTCASRLHPEHGRGAPTDGPAAARGRGETRP